MVRRVGQHTMYVHSYSTLHILQVSHPPAITMLARWVRICGRESESDSVQLMGATVWQKKSAIYHAYFDKAEVG